MASRTTTKAIPATFNKILIFKCSPQNSARNTAVTSGYTLNSALDNISELKRDHNLVRNIELTRGDSIIRAVNNNDELKREHNLLRSTELSHANVIQIAANDNNELKRNHNLRIRSAKSRWRKVDPRVFKARVSNSWLDGDSSFLHTSWLGTQEGRFPLFSETRFPVVWLRDNCQCPECYHRSAAARLVLMKDQDARVKPEHVETTNGDVTITWSDGHQSTFTSAWLYERRFTQDARDQLSQWAPRKPVTWTHSDMQNNIPTDTFDNIMSDDKALYNWLCTVEEKGVFLVKNAPTNSETEKLSVREIGKRVAFLKTTNYGINFTVKAKMEASNAAYTDATLGLHTDLPYYQYCPGVQMLSCLKQVPTKGGENQLADGFYVAEYMRENHPEEFRILATTPVRFVDVGTDYYEYHKLYSTPIISVSDSGSISRVTYNDQVRDSTMSIPVEEVPAFYRALKLFNTLLYDNCITLKLQEGDIICFHNYRVLHGRTGFQVLADGERHLEGGYIDWDEMYSRRRVLQKKLNL